MGPQKVASWKGNGTPAISRKSRLVKYYNLARSHTFSYVIFVCINYVVFWFGVVTMGTYNLHFLGVMSL